MTSEELYDLLLKGLGNEAEANDAASLRAARRAEAGYEVW